MDEQFGHWLQRQLDRREMRQADLVRALGVSRSAVSDWINGKRVPDPASCDLIGDALDIAVDVVLTKAGHRPPTEAIDFDSPVARLMGRAQSVNWSADETREQIIADIMGRWIMADRKREKAEGE